ncbi:MAG: 50S ribosomal protein L29, partial [Chlamydiia bacterium]|nr:50S ribosomal protein L29 [Chlamydiia bacterium]
MKATQSNKDARGLDDAALEEKIANAKNELMNLRFRKASGQ